MVEKEELELTCTEYWIAFVLVVVEGFHCRLVEQPEDVEQEPSGSAITTGVVGGVVETAPDTVKLSVADIAEICWIATESRAWTRQYQVPLPRVGDQVVVVIHPDV